MISLINFKNASRPCRLLTVLVAAVLFLLSSTLVHSASPNPMSSSSPATVVEVPARIAGLAFSYLRPADFQVVDRAAVTVLSEDSGYVRLSGAFLRGPNLNHLKLAKAFFFGHRG